MSRRITFVALAASLTLTATQAAADRECFDDACRVQEIAEPQAAPPQAQAAPELAAPANDPIPEFVVPETAAAGADASASGPRADASRRTPPILQPPSGVPQYTERLQPSGPAAASVRPVRAVPATTARVERAPVSVAVPSPDYAAPQRPMVIDVARQRPSIASAAVIEVPGEIQTGDGLVTVYPNLRPDPAWKLCQIDSRDLGRRSYRCTAYSYFPYGEGGYRPYGTYRNYPTSPGYVFAPSARIISIDPND